MTAPRPAPTLVDVPEEDAGSITAAPRFATRQRVAANIGRPASLGPFVVIVGAALILGLAALRLARPRHATLALASSLPKRSLVEIDGRPTLAPDVGGTLDLPPGRHLVTLVLPRNDRREYSIDVRAGDRILVFPLLRGSAGAAYEGRDP